LSDVDAIASPAESARNARFTVETFPSIDSTSNELKRRAEVGTSIDRIVVVAHTQSAGRGRMGRTWIDQPGGSLLFSIGWHAAVPAAKLAGLSLAIGVAAVDALETEGVAGLQLKWPNDVMLRHRKLGGILIETVNARDDALDVILGVGINLSLSARNREHVDGGVIALGDTGWQGDPQKLLNTLLVSLSDVLDRFPRDGFAPWRERWIQRHAHQQRNVTIWRSGREIAAGRAIDIDVDGALLLQTTAGLQRFTSGESTLRTS
jgi:BirA family biotin operon repressor/biotin-[acetyl-CoA-carboxylase] ligase